MIRLLSVVGLPDGQKRPRGFQRGGRIIFWSPTSAWRELVYGRALESRPTVPFDGPLQLKTIFYFPRPESIKKSVVWKSTKPDLDNLLKAVMDALTQARWWKDDGRVARVVMEKRFVGDGEASGALIEVAAL